MDNSLVPLPIGRRGTDSYRTVAKLRRWGIAAAITAAVAGPDLASAGWSGYIAGELRWFPKDPADPRQFEGINVSISAEPEYYREFSDGSNLIGFVPFGRIDEHDDERTHIDIRELDWIHVRDRWELRLGIRRVFWGVTESQHLVDIINQTDLVENIDGEDKLGQPMVNLALVRDWGTVDLFALAGFRERTFPGFRGRLRQIPRVDESMAEFESAAGNGRVDFAARWKHFVGDWDIGLSQFHGTSRDPRFTLGETSEGEPVLAPFYDVIDQTGLDVQATKGGWLWKLEGIYRAGQGKSFAAATAGFEFTLFDLAGRGADLGLLLEYLWDSRGADAPAAFQDDLFGGIRLALNDVQSTELLTGIIYDLDQDERLFNLEASRRLGNRWRLSVEARAFSNIFPQGSFVSLRQDSYIQAELAYFF